MLPRPKLQTSFFPLLLSTACAGAALWLCLPVSGTANQSRTSQEMIVLDLSTVMDTQPLFIVMEITFNYGSHMLCFDGAICEKPAKVTCVQICHRALSLKLRIMSVGDLIQW